jgi:hypothetical protein
MVLTALSSTLKCAGASQGQQLAKLSPCDVQALQKCLKENKGDRAKVRLDNDKLMSP